MPIHVTLQTGTISHRNPQAPSNFFTYTVGARHEKKVQKAIDSAQLSMHGLEYDKEFLNWIMAEHEAYYLRG